MKIAVAGKGGSGKTTVAGTLARVLAHEGHRVLAIDADPAPNLAVSLGLSSEAMASITPVPHSFVHHTEDEHGRYSVGMSVSPAQIVADYGTPAPDGITLLLIGRVELDQAGAG